jgi:hypothetical protein
MSGQFAASCQAVAYRWQAKAVIAAWAAKGRSARAWCQITFLGGIRLGFIQLICRLTE